MRSGVEMILAERRRQIEEEGWTAEHDSQHGHGELANAAAAYALHSTGDGLTAREIWPFDWEWWKPRAPIDDLVRAGALIAAEIDRILAELGL